MRMTKSQSPQVTRCTSMLPFAAGLVTCVGTSAYSGTVSMEFSAEMYRVDSSGNRVSSGAGDYGVFDVYASFNQPGIRVLNVYNMGISLSTGNFVHNDSNSGSGSGSGKWNASYDSFGAVVGADSFVTMGTATTPNAAALDGNFLDTGSTEHAGFISPNAGWYASTPTDGWGNVDANNQVFLGRFVITDGGSASGVTLTFDSKTFTMPTAGSNAVPGLGGVAALAGVGLVRRRRRR